MCLCGSFFFIESELLKSNGDRDILYFVIFKRHKEHPETFPVLFT